MQTNKRSRGADHTKLAQAACTRQVNFRGHSRALPQRLLTGTRETSGEPVHIGLDPSVTPVHAPTDRVPVAKLDRVNEELKRLCEEGIIMPVTQPTDWLSNMLVKGKPNGKLRICIDPSQTINREIKRPKYTYP